MAFFQENYSLETAYSLYFVYLLDNSKDFCKEVSQCRERHSNNRFPDIGLQGEVEAMLCRIQNIFLLL